jgi:O-antigen ligase
MSSRVSGPDSYLPGAIPGGATLHYNGGALVWYQTLLLAGALGVIYLNLPIYLYTLNTALLPKYFFFGIFFLIAPLIVLYYRSFVAYLMSPFVVWAALFLILNLIHLAGFSATGDLAGTHLADNYGEARQSLVTTRAQYVVFAVFLGFAVYISPRKFYLYMFVLLVVVLPCAVMVDFAKPGTLYPVDTDGAVLGRAAAMFINPTMAGEAILHVLLLGCAVCAVKYRLPLFLLAGAGVLTTFSRSSIIAWVLLLLILVVKKTLPRSALFTTLIVFGVALVFVGHFESYLHSRQELEDASSNLLSRLNFFSSFTFDDDSSEERASVIRASWDMFLQNPIFGAGAGAPPFWSQRGRTHNQLLLLAAEYGIFGVGLWAWLLVVLWKGQFFEDKGLQMAMVFLYLFMSLFTHAMFDAATYWLATFALISVRHDSIVNRSTQGPLQGHH